MPAHKRFIKGVTDPVTLIALVVFLSSVIVGTYLSSKTDSFDLRRYAILDDYLGQTQDESNDSPEVNKDWDTIKDVDDKDDDENDYTSSPEVNKEWDTIKDVDDKDVNDEDDDENDYTSSPEVNKEWGIIKELSEEGTADPSDPKYDEWGGPTDDEKGGKVLYKPAEADPLPLPPTYTTVEECGGNLSTSECFCTVQNCYSFDDEGNLLWAHGEDEKNTFKELIAELDDRGMLISKGNRLSIDKNLDGMPDDDDLLDRAYLKKVIYAVSEGYGVGYYLVDVTPTKPTTEDITEGEQMPPSTPFSIPVDVQYVPSEALEAYKDCVAMGGSTFGCSRIYDVCGESGACDFTKGDLVDAGIIPITEQDLADAGIIPITEQDIIDSGGGSVIQKYLDCMTSGDSNCVDPIDPIKDSSSSKPDTVEPAPPASFIDNAMDTLGGIVNFALSPFAAILNPPSTAQETKTTEPTDYGLLTTFMETMSDFDNFFESLLTSTPPQEETTTSTQQIPSLEATKTLTTTQEDYILRPEGPEVYKDWGTIKELSEEGKTNFDDPKYDEWGKSIKDEEDETESSQEQSDFEIPTEYYQFISNVNPDLLGFDPLELTIGPNNIPLWHIAVMVYAATKDGTDPEYIQKMMAGVYINRADIGRMWEGEIEVLWDGMYILPTNTGYDATMKNKIYMLDRSGTIEDKVQFMYDMCLNNPNSCETSTIRFADTLQNVSEVYYQEQITGVDPVNGLNSHRNPPDNYEIRGEDYLTLEGYREATYTDLAYQATLDDTFKFYITPVFTPTDWNKRTGEYTPGNPTIYVFGYDDNSLNCIDFELCGTKMPDNWEAPPESNFYDPAQEGQYDMPDFGSTVNEYDEYSVPDDTSKENDNFIISGLGGPSIPDAIKTLRDVGEEYLNKDEYSVPNDTSKEDDTFVISGLGGPSIPDAIKTLRDVGEEYLNKAVNIITGQEDTKDTADDSTTINDKDYALLSPEAGKDWGTIKELSEKGETNFDDPKYDEGGESIKDEKEESFFSEIINDIGSFIDSINPVSWIKPSPKAPRQAPTFIPPPDLSFNPEGLKDWGTIKELSEKGETNFDDPKYDEWGGPDYTFSPETYNDKDWKYIENIEMKTMDLIGVWQRDPEWTNYLLAEDITMLNAGCGESGLAMLLGTYIDPKYLDPRIVWEEILQPMGITDPFLHIGQIEEVLKEFGFEWERIYPEEVPNYLDGDNEIWVLANIPGGIEHHTIITDYEYTDDELHFNLQDPYYNECDCAVTGYIPAPWYSKEYQSLDCLRLETGNNFDVKINYTYAVSPP